VVTNIEGFMNDKEDIFIVLYSLKQKRTNSYLLITSTFPLPYL